MWLYEASVTGEEATVGTEIRYGPYTTNFLALMRMGIIIQKEKSFC